MILTVRTSSFVSRGCHVVDACWSVVHPAGCRCSFLSVPQLTNVLAQTRLRQHPQQFRRAFRNLMSAGSNMCVSQRDAVQWLCRTRLVAAQTHCRGLSQKRLGLQQIWEDVSDSGQLKVPLVGPSLLGWTLCGNSQHGLILRHRLHLLSPSHACRGLSRCCHGGRRKGTYRLGFGSMQPREVMRSFAKLGHGCGFVLEATASDTCVERL